MERKGRLYHARSAIHGERSNTPPESCDELLSAERVHLLERHVP